MPVTLPANVASPPAADSWLAVSAVTVSAVVAPRPTPAASSAAPATTGRGPAEPRRRGLRFRSRAAGRGWAEEKGSALTPTEWGTDGDRIMKRPQVAAGMRCAHRTGRADIVMKSRSHEASKTVVGPCMVEASRLLPLEGEAGAPAGGT